MTELNINAYAKINLTLEVVRRLPTGYHELRTVFQQVELCDHLTIADVAGDDVELDCEESGLAGPDNLVWRAADLLRRTYHVRRGVRMCLGKCIPIGGGLAGGSSDAAATLMGLNELWQLDLERYELQALAVQLGMDVPFCVLGGTALGLDRGETLESLPALPPLDVVIAHPGVSSSTADAYAALRPEHMGGGAATAAMVNAIVRGDVQGVARGLHNVFEPNLISRLPAIGRIKQLMLENGAWNAALSGSGACVFALTGSRAQAETMAKVIASEFPHVYVTRTRS